MKQALEKKSEDMKLLYLVSILLATLVFAAAESNGRRLLPGGWTQIKDLNDPQVIDIAKFAISEHNKQANSNLTLGRIVKGESQVISGIKYRLVLAAADGGSYEAVVVEQAWRHFRQLTSFKQL